LFETARKVLGHKRPRNGVRCAVVRSQMYFCTWNKRLFLEECLVDQPVSFTRRLFFSGRGLLPCQSAGGVAAFGVAASAVGGAAASVAGGVLSAAGCAVAASAVGSGGPCAGYGVRGGGRGGSTTSEGGPPGGGGGISARESDPTPWSGCAVGASGGGCCLAEGPRWRTDNQVLVSLVVVVFLESVVVAAVVTMVRVQRWWFR
jgi:hypothetical protein